MPAAAPRSSRGAVAAAQGLLCLAGLLWIAAVPRAAGAADYPARKPGLWEMRTTSAPGEAPQVAHQCIDAASDAAMREMGMGMQKEMCSRQSLRQEGATLVVDAVCTLGPTTATLHTVVSGDFQSAFRSESRATYQPPLMGRSRSDTVVEARWTGPCLPGQRPGDMVLPNGMKMNLLDMKAPRR